MNRTFIRTPKIWRKWRWTRSGFVNHLALIQCFITYEKWVQKEILIVKPYSSEPFFLIWLLILIGHLYPSDTWLGVALKHTLLALHPLLVRCEMGNCTQNLANPDRACRSSPTPFFLIHGVHTNILFNVKVKILFLIKNTINYAPQLYWCLNLEWLTNFKPLVQSPLNTLFMSILRSTPNHAPLNQYKCLFDTSNQIRHVHLISLATRCSHFRHCQMVWVKVEDLT